MKTLLNFSHALTDKAKAQIETLEGPFEEVIIPVQLDLDRDIWGQIADIEAGSHGIRLYEADMVIPPAFSAAAFILATDHLLSRHMNSRPKVVWLKNAGLEGFVLGGIE